MKNGKTFPFSFVNIDEPRYFAYRTPLPGCTIDWYWRLEAAPAGDAAAGLTLVQGCTASGWLSTVYKWMLHGQLMEAFDHGLANMNATSQLPQYAAAAQ